MLRLNIALGKGIPSLPANTPKKAVTGYSHVFDTTKHTEHLLPAYKTALGKVAGQGDNKTHRTLIPCLQDHTIGKVAGQGYNTTHRTLTLCLQDRTIGKVAGQGYNKTHRTLTPCLQDGTRQSRRSEIQHNTQNTYSLPTRLHWAKSPVRDTTKHTEHLLPAYKTALGKVAGQRYNTTHRTLTPCLQDCTGQSRQSGIQQNTQNTYSLPTRRH